MNSWKYRLKRAVPQIGSRFQWAFRPRIVILCYHSIHSTRSFRSATPVFFDTHLQWLKEHCDVMPLHTLLSSPYPDDLHSRPKVAITFDDGYVDNYEYAFPLLMKHGLPATFFVTAGFLERDPEVIERFRFLRRESPEEVEPLTWKQVQEMVAAGLEFGSHTYSHPNLTTLKNAEVELELKKAKDILEERIGQEVRGFAYPFGRPRSHFNGLTLSLVQQVGYQYALAVCYRRVLPRDSQWALPRLCVTEDSVEELRTKIEGGWDLLGYFQEWAPLWLARMVSPADWGV